MRGASGVGTSDGRCDGTSVGMFATRDERSEEISDESAETRDGTGDGINRGNFRLGARVLQSRSRDQVRVTEAISQAFAVRDHRGKMNKKHDHPSLDDEILNDCTESDWEEIVQHASSVVDDEKLNASSKPLISPTTVPHQERLQPCIISIHEWTLARNCSERCLRDFAEFVKNTRAVLDIMAGNSVSVEEMASIMEPIIQKLGCLGHYGREFCFCGRNGIHNSKSWLTQSIGNNEL
ncbi:hypothetical protein QYF36_003660 [Acer negundo]|nr:hypothetical protein QYF36_003660 [Acer negundo]